MRWLRCLVRMARQTHESRLLRPLGASRTQTARKWRFVYDGSIQATQRVGRRQEPARDSAYKVELNSPVLEYAEMGKLQEVVRALRHAGAAVNPSCGLHVPHVDASQPHAAQPAQPAVHHVLQGGPDPEGTGDPAAKGAAVLPPVAGKCPEGDP